MSGQGNSRRIPLKQVAGAAGRPAAQRLDKVAFVMQRRD
jgi:hypothetical protein